jgi:hypothetical protein
VVENSADSAPVDCKNSADLDKRYMDYTLLFLPLFSFILAIRNPFHNETGVQFSGIKKAKITVPTTVILAYSEDTYK